MIHQPGRKWVYNATPTTLHLLYTQHWAAVRARQGGGRQQENEASINNRPLFFNLNLFFFTKALLFEGGRKIKEKTRPRKSSNFTAHLPPHPPLPPQETGSVAFKGFTPSIPGPLPTADLQASVLRIGLMKINYDSA